MASINLAVIPNVLPASLSLGKLANPLFPRALSGDVLTLVRSRNIMAGLFGRRIS